MEQIYYPKVLILIQPFNHTYGRGITLSNLFKGWDKHQIAVAGLAGLIDSNTETSICDTYYQLGQKEVKWKWPLRAIKRKHYSGIIELSSRVKSKYIPKKSKWRSNFSIKYIDPLLVKLGLFEFLYRIDLSDDFKTWLTDFNPDLVYAQAQNRGRVLFCTRVQRFLGKPMVFHMMDDWLELVKSDNFLAFYWYKKTYNDFQNMLNLCTLHLSISDGMAAEYKKRFGVSFTTFHNPIEYSFWVKGQKTTYELGDVPTVLYAGRTGLGIQSSLEIMARAIEIINVKFNLGVKFVLQVSEKESWMVRYGCIIHRSYVPYDDLPYKFGEADVLFLPYDFSEKAISFIKYSMPTKASEYMVSGTPILIMAPPDTSLVQYAEAYNWGDVVTDATIDGLVSRLSDLLLDKEKRKDLGRRAVKVALERHDANKVREDFRSQLVSLLE